MIVLPATGLRLYREPVIHDHLRGLFPTARSFRAFCRGLRVPVIHMGAHRYLNAHTLAIAIQGVTRLGSADYYAPGSAARDKGVPAEGKRDIGSPDPAQIKVWARELVAAALSQQSHDVASLKSDTKRAADAITEHLVRMRIMAPQVEPPSEDLE